MTKNNFIVVSNRLPVTVTREKGKLKYTQSPGGLATAMSSLESDNMLWVGWPGINAEDLSTAEKKVITARLKEFGCVPVFLNATQIEQFYEGYSNETLWPLFHYFQGIAQYNESHWTAYEKVNELYARTVQKHANPE